MDEIFTGKLEARSAAELVGALDEGDPPVTTGPASLRIEIGEPGEPVTIELTARQDVLEHLRRGATQVMIGRSRHERGLLGSVELHGAAAGSALTHRPTIVDEPVVSIHRQSGMLSVQTRVDVLDALGGAAGRGVRMRIVSDRLGDT